jgi:quercetin dioxygenase-like cupin family protein
MLATLILRMIEADSVASNGVHVRHEIWHNSRSQEERDSTMHIITIDSLKPSGGGAARFEGVNYDANSSFFVVTSPTGRGANKHRHPYEEIFVILDGDIEAIIDGETHRIGRGHIVVIPANAWHEFKNRSERPALMVNIHPVPKMIQEDWASSASE